MSEIFLIMALNNNEISESKLNVNSSLNQAESKALFIFKSGSISREKHTFTLCSAYVNSFQQM